MNKVIDVSKVVLETERLVLRSFTYNDLEDLFEYASVSGVGEAAGWPHHKDINESKEILARFINSKKTFAIVYKENNKVIGSIGVEEYNSEKLPELDDLLGREIGFVLSKDYWGRGLMPEAAGRVIRYLFDVEGLDFLTCGHFDINERSAHVQKKLGFKEYKRLIFDTSLGVNYPGVLNILYNKNKYNL